jgi:hypothetical protein
MKKPFACTLHSPERRQRVRSRNIVRILAFCVGTVLVTPYVAWSQTASPSFAASPEVYRVIAENDQYRMILATWKPGQRDAWHSHGPTVGNYFLTDCHLRAHTPDGKSVENQRSAGFASVSGRVASHSVENIGSSECKVILFEPK